MKKFEDYRSMLSHISSTTPLVECEIIWRIAQELPSNAIIVEIGTGKGRITAMLACLSEDFSIYSVDDYSEACRYAWTAEEAKSFLTSFRNVKLIIKKSEDFAKEFSNFVDMVFVDGSHKYENVCKDIDVWYPKIKIGGIISGHDYDMAEVSKAVIERLNKTFVEERVWWTIKC